jgi:hypothetical protein
MSVTPDRSDLKHNSYLVKGSSFQNGTTQNGTQSQIDSTHLPPIKPVTNMNRLFSKEQLFAYFFEISTYLSLAATQSIRCSSIGHPDNFATRKFVKPENTRSLAFGFSNLHGMSGRPLRMQSPTNL